jgi:protein-tyrosine phosphatase
LFFNKKIKVLFVCMGNLCRSPTAHAVFAHAVAQARLTKRIRVESAGTHVGRSGDPADARAMRAAGRRGYDMSRLRTRPLQASDYQRFDYLLAMDEQNLALLVKDCPEQHRHKIALLMAYSAAGEVGAAVSVPDPYYGAPQGFERVLDMAEDAAQGLLRYIRRQHGL